MINVHRHNPALRARLKPLTDSGNAEGLKVLLNNLSNSEFRTAGYLLAEDLLPAIPSVEVFLNLFFNIVPTNARAYLGTFLKAATAFHADGRLKWHEAGWEAYAETASPIDRRKILDAFLPSARSVAEAKRLVSLFAPSELTARLSYLLKAGTTESYYLMFCLLRSVDDDHAIIRQQYLQLLKRGDQRSFNMACILRQYFDLRDLPGEFSLNLRPYELSRLDLSPETFTKILNQ